MFIPLPLPPEALLEAYKFIGALLIILGLVGGISLMHPKLHRSLNFKLAVGFNCLFAASSSVGIGLFFRIFGTPLGEWLLLSGDTLLVIAMIFFVKYVRAEMGK